MVKEVAIGALSQADSRDSAPRDIVPGYCGDVATGILKEEGSARRIVVVVVDIEVDAVKSAETALACGGLSEIRSGDTQVGHKIMPYIFSAPSGPVVDSSGGIVNSVTHK